MSLHFNKGKTCCYSKINIKRQLQQQRVCRRVKLSEPQLMLLCKNSSLQPSYQHYMKGLRVVSSGNHPCVSTLYLPGVSDQISQAFPLCSCIFQVIKE